jgi:hypothetical protein
LVNLWLRMTEALSDRSYTAKLFNRMESTYATSKRFEGLSADGETPGRKAPPTHISGAAAMWLAIGSSIPPRDP